MIGQPTIDNFINSFSTKFSARCNLIIGERGCGKHLLIKELSGRLKLPLTDITECVDGDFVSSMYERTVSIIYFVNLSEMQRKRQNVLLKVIEEPPTGAFIFLLAENHTQVLPTILNRCNIVTFSPYKKEDLLKFMPIGSDNEMLDRALMLCKTPGQVKDCIGTDLGGLIEFTDKIVDKIGNANIANTMSIVNKLAFKNEKGLWDYTLFSRSLLCSIRNKALQKEDTRLYRALWCVAEHIKIDTSYNVDKKANMENMLINLWGIFRDSTGT